MIADKTIAHYLVSQIWLYILKVEPVVFGEKGYIDWQS
jgi:hypothetical protein